MAAGEGARMRSEIPKPLHTLCGRPMLLHVVDALSDLLVDRVVVVVGHGAEPVAKTLHELGTPGLVLDFVEQHVPRGTGDAVSVALTAFPDDDSDDGDIVIVPGDTPLVRPATLGDLVVEHRNSGAAATILTAAVVDPSGEARVVRTKDGAASRVIDDSDTTESEREIDEVSTSIFCFRRSLLAPALRRVSPDNAKGEYHLGDVVEVLHRAGHKVVALEMTDPTEALAVNDRADLATAEAEVGRRINRGWMRAGVTMVDPARTYVDCAAYLAPDVVLLPGTMIQGRTVVGAGARLGPDVHLTDCAVGERAAVESTVGHDAEIGPGARVGPFAVLRPGTHIAADAVTGPFYNAGTGDDEGT